MLVLEAADMGVPTGLIAVGSELVQGLPKLVGLTITDEFKILVAVVVNDDDAIESMAEKRRGLQPGKSVLPRERKEKPSNYYTWAAAKILTLS